MKWLLFKFFIPQNVPMQTSIIIKSTSKFLNASCVLLMAGFIRKKVNYILGGATQILRSNGIYALRRWWFKLVCFGNMLANFTPWFIARTIEILLGFKVLWTSPGCPLNSFLFQNLLLENSQKLFCVPYPVLEEDEF